MWTARDIDTSRQRRLALLAPAAALAALMAAGCSKPEPEPVPVRAVKTLVFGGQQASSTRGYAAQARAAVRSSLAFQVGGRVLETRAGVGDRVQKGAILARLDERPLQLRVQQAQAELRRAEAALVEAVRRAEAQQTLMAGGFGTRQELDQAIANEAAARSAVQSAGSALALAQRDVALAVIRAPHAGIVAARTVEPFAEVQPGQAVFELDGLSGIEVVALVPVAVAQQLRGGQSLPVRVSGAAQPLAVQVTAIGQRSTQAETVPVIARPTGQAAPSLLLPGSYAELQVAVNAPQPAPVVPVEAVLPAAAGSAPMVFVVGQDRKVARRAVALGPVTQQGVVVASGLRSGETIVATGVGFLRDGQPVRLLPPPVR